MSKKFNIKEVLSIAFSHHIAVSAFESGGDDVMPEEFMEYFKNKINPNRIPDKTLVSNSNIHDNINWNIMDRNKVIRILARDISLINRFDLDVFNFSITEWYPIFLQHPYLVEEIITDFSSINPLESIKLLECNQDLIEIIDITKLKFKKKDMLEIIKKFKRSEKIMERLDLTQLDHYSSRRLLCDTGTDYVDKLDLNKIKATDWLEILDVRPELIEYCNLKVFETNDCYLLTKLVMKFPELDYLIKNNADKINGLGWENLLKFDIDKYQDMCKWEKLSENSWSNILRAHPYLKPIKQKYFLF